MSNVRIPGVPDIGEPPVYGDHVTGVLIEGIPLEQFIVTFLLFRRKLSSVNLDRISKLT